MRGKPISEETKKIIQDLGEKGFNIRQIANALGVSESVMNHHIKKYNIHYEKKQTKYTFEENCEIFKNNGKKRVIRQLEKNNESRETAKNYGKEWTPEEEQKLIELYGSGKSYKEISLEIGRTIQSISFVVYKLNLKRRKFKHLTETEKKFIKKNYKTMSESEIARKLNRSKSTIRNYKFRTFKD